MRLNLGRGGNYWIYVEFHICNLFDKLDGSGTDDSLNRCSMVTYSSLPSSTRPYQASYC
jgi:hypothetical protein